MQLGPMTKSGDWREKAVFYMSSIGPWALSASWWKTLPYRISGVSSYRRQEIWRPSSKFVMQCSSLSKVLEWRGGTGLFSLRFKELSWFKEAAVVSNSVMGRKFSHFFLSQSHWWKRAPVIEGAEKMSLFRLLTYWSQSNSLVWPC